MARPRSNEYDDKRQRILDQAAALFATHGFAASSISMLANACGASKALVYHYYDSKQAILFDMLDQHVEHLVEITQSVLEQEDDPQVLLRRLLKTLMGTYVHSRDKHVVLMNEIGSLPQHQRDHLISLQNDMVHGVAELIARINPAVRRKRKGQTTTAMVLMGMINWTYTWFRADGSLSPEAYADLAAGIFLNGILGTSPR